MRESSLDGSTTGAWSGLPGGLIVGTVSVVMAVSFAALLFPGPLAPHLAQGLALALIATALNTTAIGLFASLPGTVGGTQSVPVAILATMSGAVVTSLSGRVSDEALFSTVAVVLGLGTVWTGVVLILLGHWRAGRMVRFLPYPVIGGVLAGSGWLLAKGAFGIMLAGSNAGQEPLRWAPAVIWALVMLLLSRRASHPLLMLAAVVVGIVTFHGVARALGWTTPALADAGWLLRVPGAASIAPLPAAIDWSAVDWTALRRVAGEMATMPIVTAVALLLNGAGLETATGRSVDLDRELKAAGVANLASGTLGGLPGYQQLGLSAMNVRAGARTRWVGAWAGLLATLTLLFGASALASIPRAVLGALLLFVALSMARDWIVQSWGRLSALDHGIVVLIVGVTVLVGFLPGVICGLVAAVALFAVNYGRIDPVRNDLSAVRYGSRVSRSSAERSELSRCGGAIRVLELQGFLFFGVADRLLARAREQLESAPGPDLRFLILDCRRVTGVDSSVAQSFARLHSFLSRHQVDLVLTHAASGVRAQFEAGSLPEMREGYRQFANLDLGLEWCENQLLREAESRAVESRAGESQEAESRMGESRAAHSAWTTPRSLRELLSRQLGVAGTDRLWASLERKVLRAGDRLVTHGDPADDLYFLESGALSALREKTGQAPIRLETSREPGAVLGEVGFYLRATRTAAVVADEPTVVYRLASGELTRLEREAPEIAAALHRLVAERLAARVAHLVTVVDALEG
ncbi:MAG: SLC26A/SulP transporter family protein [Candidatus Eisenbacteria bacterium]|nr:SLC26A/SulP transporter family protein [Candidatus Eisenbacteria bacterium]